MPASAKLILGIAALLGAAAVALGAFGAHALRTRVSPEMLAAWQTASQYHFWHTLALLAVGLTVFHLPGSKWLAIAAVLFVFGILMFSGSLYLIALGWTRALGPATPVGGVALVLGWLALALAALRT
jgi:uncharacterized membrane protein YgdD (TMEM256/DUF423 family)